MGKVYPGISPMLMLELRGKYNLRYFVETGTLNGGTARLAAKYFEKVWTIEKNENRYLYAMQQNNGLKNIYYLLGDSRQELPRVLRTLKDPALIWLDAHWVNSKSRPDDCPLLQELDTILECNYRHIVMIDDAQFFTGKLPERADTKLWPDINMIVDKFDGRYCLEIVDDVIVAQPIAEITQ